MLIHRAISVHNQLVQATSFGGEQCISPMKSFCLKQYSLRGTLTRVATVSVPIVAETCARRGAGFSRFLQLVPGEGESQTTGKLCVLHFFYKGQLNIASLSNGRTKRKWDAMRSLESGDRIELFYEDSPEATIRATVSRLTKSDLTVIAAHHRKDISEVYHEEVHS